VAAEQRMVVGKALGILMERFELDDDDAFAYLVLCSDMANRQLCDIANELVEYRVIQTSPAVHRDPSMASSALPEQPV
jgi:AmiR/NasT family two-component response regulator